MSDDHDDRIPLAAAVTVGTCGTCDAIHIDLWRRDAEQPFARAALPPRNWSAFLADFKARMREAGAQVEGDAAIDESDPLIEVIKTAIRQHSSPTIGRGDVHGGQRGYIVYEIDGLPFIIATILRAVRN